MTPMIDEFGEQRPELRTPERNDRGERICPRCEVPLDEFGGVGFAEIPTTAWELPSIVERCKAAGVDELRSRGWICPEHSRPIHLLRTCDGPAAHGWEACCGARIRLDDGREEFVPIALTDLPGPIEEAIRGCLP